MKIRFRATAVAALAVPALLLAGCGGSSSSAPAGDGSPAASETAGGGGQPDVNGDGQVVIGIMSPGDTKDNGYYQSFVDEANTFAADNGWKVITIDKINPSDGKNQALNLCRQKADLIAIGASELKDALAATTDPVCEGVNWYMNGGVGVEQTKYFAQSTENLPENLFNTGYAAGLAMKEKGITKAGYISGPEADFSKQAAVAFLLGIQEVIPDATLAETYTGDFNDSAKAKEAAQAQISQGVGLIYPYLGGATDAVATLANENNILTVTPGTDRCEDPTTPFSISSIFSPGAYFAAALGEFKNNSLEMGKTREWRVGKDPVPSVKLCGEFASLQPQADEMMKKIGDGEIDIQSKFDAAYKG